MSEYTLQARAQRLEIFINFYFMLKSFSDYFAIRQNDCSDYFETYFPSIAGVFNGLRVMIVSSRHVLLLEKNVDFALKSP